MIKACSILVVALLAAACSTAATEAAPEAETESAISPRIFVQADIALQTVTAIELWRAATDDAYAPDLTVSDACDQNADLCIRLVPERPTGCGEDAGGALACFRPDGYIDIWSGVRDVEIVSVIAHELGHSLGLLHGDAGIMRPHRDRTMACIEGADLAALEASTRVVGQTACVR